MKTPELKEMLKHGVHFGHQVSRWHPKMDKYIFGVRNGIHIIDLEKSAVELQRALDFVVDIVSKGGTILFVGTKRQGRDIIEKNALDCGMPYVNSRWLGGLLTNFSVLFKLIKKYKGLKSKQESGKLAKYTKKEQLKFSREIEKLDSMVGGISSLERLPEAVFILDLKCDKTAYLEAQKRNVPVIAVCDTNVDPTNVDYPIPSNDDATKAIGFIVGLICQAVKEGKNIKPKLQLDKEVKVKKSKENNVEDEKIKK